MIANLEGRIHVKSSESHNPGKCRKIREQLFILPD